MRHLGLFALTFLLTSIPPSLTSVSGQTTRARGPAGLAEPESIDPKLPDVLIIGDSISIGYTADVRELLHGKANVFRPPANCGPTSRGVSELNTWLGDRGWDVIHFNFGLHDLKFMSPDGENLADPNDPANARQVAAGDYVKNLRTILERLTKSDAALIWRETTPVPVGSKGRIAGDAIFYNSLAAEVIREFDGVQVDPMHGYASRPPIASLQRPANVHYTDQGSRLLAKHVVNAIEACLRRRANER